MARTLRELLIQRAARLQDRPALTAAGWGTLAYTGLRNRVEGVAFGLLAAGQAGPLYAATGTAWDWAAELAAAAAGLAWDPEGLPVPPEVLGGRGFHPEAGRGLYHARESGVAEDTPFYRGLSQGEVLRRLARLNDRLGWDHDTEVALPASGLGDPAVRAALWSALYGGSHAVLAPAAPAGRSRRAQVDPGAWDPILFAAFWD